MRMPALLSATVLAAAVSAQDKTPREPGGPPADRVAELRKERIAALREAADDSLKLATNYRAPFRDALEDRMAVLRAELEDAQTEADRTAARKQALAALKELEEVARARWERGTGAKVDLLRVKARRLEVELQSERAAAGPPR